MSNVFLSGVKAPASATVVPETVNANLLIVDYSEKALAVFGDTKAVKDRLKALGGRFNLQLTHQGVKQAGWIFSKKREEQLRNTLNGSANHRGAPKTPSLNLPGKKALRSRKIAQDGMGGNSRQIISFAYN
ncbi:MAG: hypothetical protein LBC81_04270 [Tannerellaceae bacterium]|jgi:hypothetical protein|nr:hypothetical protein [Tannerellaceae bacterium]